MVRTTSFFAPLALVVLGMGCSHNPLVGTWTQPVMVATFSGTESFEVNGDGTLVVLVQGAGSSCSGTWTYSGYSWASTASSVTWSGTPMCTGSLTCGNVTVACSSNTSQLQAGSCTYALSSDDNTLTLTGCTGMSNATLIRTQ
jgi:hypothetical protein